MSIAHTTAKWSAVLALSTLALTACSSTPEASENSPTTQEQETPAPVQATEATAADYANSFFAELVKPDEKDYTDLKLPVELNEEQMQQLLVEGRVDGVSDKKAKELVDFMYANYPMGDFLYLPDNASTQNRLQAILILVLAKEYGTAMAEEEAPAKIKAEDVSLIQDPVENSTYANFTVDNGDIAPQLIFVANEWKIDGEALLTELQ